MAPLVVGIFDIREIVEADGLAEAPHTGARGVAFPCYVVHVQTLKMLEVLQEVARKHAFQTVGACPVDNGEKRVHQTEVPQAERGRGDVLVAVERLRIWVLLVHTATNLSCQLA